MHWVSLSSLEGPEDTIYLKNCTCQQRSKSFTIGEGNGTPLQYSRLENPMDGGDWWAAVHGVRKSRTRLSHFTFTFHFHALEKAMATHSSVLAWRIPGTAEPGGLRSMRSHRVRQDWSDLAAAAAAAAFTIVPLASLVGTRIPQISWESHSGDCDHLDNCLLNSFFFFFFIFF